MLLLEQFENLTLHPKNAARLKELVLQLAMQGKLTNEWRKSNSDLLNPLSSKPLVLTLSSSKKEFLEKRKLRLRDVSELDEIKSSLPPLPNTWAWTPFPQVIFFQEGPGIRNWQFKDSGIKLINVKNIIEDNIDYTNTDKYVSINEFEEKYTHFLIEEGDILWASSGGSWGKVAWHKDPGFPVMLNTSNIRLKPFCEEVLSSQYLYYFLKSETFKKQLVPQLVGMQPNFGSTHLSRAYISLPPLAEQEAVVARVEELIYKIEDLQKQTVENGRLKKKLSFATLKALASAADEELHENWLFLKQHFQSIFDEEENIKMLRENILQLALQGKLTAAWRKNHSPTEPASKHLNRIKAKKAQLVKEKKIKKSPPLEPVSEDEVSFTLPESWAWSRLDEVGIVNPRNHVEDETLVSFIPMTLISEDYGTTPAFEERDWKSLKSGFTHVAEFDVAFAKITPCFENSKACIFKGLVNGLGAGTTELHVFRSINDDVLPEFVYIIFKSPQFLEGGKYNMRGAAGQKRVPTEFVKQFPVALPPLAEQKAIVAKVDQLMLLCDELEQQIQNSKRQSEEMMQAVVQEALQVKEEKVLKYTKQEHIVNF